MKRQRILIAAILLAVARPASAHRLDEYLQATRLAIGVDRVRVEIDLTPGVDVASTVLGWIDANHDGALSQDEATAYARQVIGDLALDVDGAAAPLALISVECSQPEAMRLGTGAVRLRVTAPVPPVAAGRHRLTFRNEHRSQSSVYLANVLVSDDPRVRVETQTRDRAQRELTVAYDVSSQFTRAWWLLSGVAALGLLVVGRRRSTP
jgi:hypothetical protein